MKQAATATGIILLMGVLMYASAEARDGAQQGLALCGGIVIPSLLPILICGNLFILSDARTFPERLLGRVTRRVLHLPEAAGPAILLGLLCGYPAGAVLTQALHSRGAVNDREAARMMRFNFGGGAAFTVTAVGSGVYGSVRIGVVLLAVNILSSLLAAVADGFLHRNESVAKASASAPALPLSDALPEAVERTVRALAVMSAYIVFCSAFLHLFRIPFRAVPLLEITAGLCSAPQPLPLPYAAFFLSFGGLCIHLQLLGFLKKMKVPYLTFLCGRLLCAVLSFGLMHVYTAVFPEECAVFANIAAPQAAFTQGSTALAAVMLTGCAVIVFDIENRKLKSA